MIELSHVTRTYGDLVAVNDLSFQVSRGEIVALLGANGAGKTTALRMIATLIRPDHGTITVAGIGTQEDPIAVRRKLGYQTGDTGLYERLTPVEFLQYAGELHMMDRSTLRRQIDSVVERFGISEFAHRPCGTLSTGQKQRVTLARTILHNPPVLVLDEPTNGLDIVSSSFILTTIRELAAAGTAVLFSTHIMGEVELVADRIVIIDHGAHQATGTLRELLDRTQCAHLSQAFLSILDTVKTGDAERPTPELDA